VAQRPRLGAHDKRIGLSPETGATAALVKYARTVQRTLHEKGLVIAPRAGVMPPARIARFLA